MMTSDQLSLQLISKEIRRAEREYMNMHPPINALVSALPLMNSVYNNHRETNNSFEEVERVHDNMESKIVRGHCMLHI